MGWVIFALRLPSNESGEAGRYSGWPRRHRYSGRERVERSFGALKARVPRDLRVCFPRRSPELVTMVIVIGIEGATTDPGEEDQPSPWRTLGGIAAGVVRQLDRKRRGRSPDEVAVGREESPTARRTVGNHAAAPILRARRSSSGVE